jgi:hypothetical protein
MKKTVTISLLFIFLFTVNSFSDAVIEMEYKDNVSQTVNKSTNSFKGSDMRMDYFEGAEQPSISTIFKGEREEMISLDHKSKSYYVMDKQTLQSLASQMNEAMAEMEKAMAGMSPEERAMMEKVMKGKMPTMKDTKHIEPTLKQAGSGNVSGYACTKYEVYKGSEKVRDLCVTSWSNIEGGSEIQSTLLKMANFMEDLSKSLSSGSNFMGSTADFEKSVFNQISKLNGFPVQTIDYSNGSVTGITTFKSSKKTSLDSSAFEAPAGYEKQEMDMQ